MCWILFNCNYLQFKHSSRVLMKWGLAYFAYILILDITSKLLCVYQYDHILYICIGGNTVIDNHFNLHKFDGFRCQVPRRPRSLILAAPKITWKNQYFFNNSQFHFIYIVQFCGIYKNLRILREEESALRKSWRRGTMWLNSC